MSATVLIILLAVAFIVLAVVMIRYRHARLPKHLSADDKGFVHVRWHEIQTQVKRGGPAHLRQAIVQADNLVDHCLKGLGTPGDTMGDRLRNGQPRFSDYDGLWKAHKSRNQVVHESEKELLSFEAKQTLERFERALKDLGAL